jgi:hypothetical protein
VAEWEHSHAGECIAFIEGQNTRPAAVLKLDKAIEFDGLSGDIVVLELRYAEASWAASGVVHIELCSSLPEDRHWKERRKGVWVESNASYETIWPAKPAFSFLVSKPMGS